MSTDTPAVQTDEPRPPGGDAESAASPSPERSRQRKDFWTAMAFLSPNFIGFLLFVSFPLAFSLYMAFTNWSIPNDSLHFVGLANFRELLSDPKFKFYFINTAYLMAGIPVGIAGSLCVAVALSQPIDIRSWKWRGILTAIIFGLSGLSLGLGKLVYLHASIPGWLWILAVLTLVIGLLAIYGGVVAFRTLFYLPSFTSGVASMILWKNLYQSNGGPINETLSISLEWMYRVATAVPRWVFYDVAAVLVGCVALVVVRLIRRVMERDFNRIELVLGVVTAIAAVGFVQTKLPMWSWFLAIPAGVLVAGALGSFLKFLANFSFDRSSDSFFGALFATGLAALLLCIGAGFLVFWAHLPQLAITPPQWLQSAQNLLGYDEIHGFQLKNVGLGARDAIVIMGLWAGMGGNTMLLYLAGLSNVPQELYEAADIDGASRWQKFWSVTWPQLAPTTFFIIVMATIGGLQGGFEQARVLTQGKPAETTVTLSYYIYTRAFQRFQLGSAAAISWFLFVVIFLLTMVNWRFGNRAVND